MKTPLDQAAFERWLTKIFLPKPIVKGPLSWSDADACGWVAVLDADKHCVALLGPEAQKAIASFHE